MNAQAIELYKQALEFAYTTIGKDHADTSYFQGTVAGKFAELIVRECMNITDEQKKWVEDMEVFNEQDATWNKARIQQSQRIVDKIKEHFGVES
jgi:hypothetical protein